MTTARGELGDLLRAWYAEGTAAGNVGDWYDNRDRGHSDLNTSPYPQLQRHVYTDDDRKAYRDWAAQQTLLPLVVFGNSSTSAGINTGGSNIRTYYTHPVGLPFLFAQYTHNNLYMYPEHCDHRPGHNGTPNHGDVYSTNTPFLIASQGSSGSDQPFMRAIPFTLAAFRPEVKAKLIQTGLLMPTVQMIMRSTMKNVAKPEDYLTGKANPSVFEGKNVDDLKMVKLAHQIALDSIPPLAQMKVLEEDSATIGKDYFEETGSEKYPDTSVVVARIFRATTESRRMIVSAEPSIDLNKRPLTYKWVLLQGDEKKVTITPKNAAGSVAEITVKYHNRRPIQPGSNLDSNRVEIGLFVNNGKYWSAPSFITYWSIDSEARTYDAKGNLLEVGYGMGDPALVVSNWQALFDLLKSDQDKPALALFKKQLIRGELEVLQAAGEEYAALNAKVKEADEKRKEAEATAKAADKDAKPKADADLKSAQKEFQDASKKVEDLLTQPRKGLSDAIRPLVDRTLFWMGQDPNFLESNREQLPKTAAFASIVNNGRKRLAGYGIIDDKPGDRLQFRPLIAQGSGPLETSLTRFEAAQIHRFNNDLLAASFLTGIVNSAWRDNFVDPRLASLKNWRDVYKYDAVGHRTGWTRYDGIGKPTEFTADGYLVVEKDAAGQPTSVKAVKYERQKTPPFLLKQVIVDQPLAYPLNRI